MRPVRPIVFNIHLRADGVVKCIARIVRIGRTLKYNHRNPEDVNFFRKVSTNAE